MIRIIAGEVDGHSLENEIAVLDHEYNDEYRDVYVVATGEQIGEPIFPDTSGDGIWEWEEVSIIPTGVINKLHAAFYDINMNEQQRAAFQALETYTF